MPRHGERIRKRNDGRWEARFKAYNKKNGSYKYVSLYGKTYTEVKEKLKEAERSQIDMSQRDTSRTLQFASIADLWLKEITLKAKGATVQKYSYTLDKHILPVLGHINITEFDRELLTQYATEKLTHGRKDNKGGLSASSVKGIMVIINSVLRYALDNKLCSFALPSNIKLTTQKKELSVLSPVDLNKLEIALANSETPTAVGILISLYMGLRIGEICALRWSDIDFERRILFVRTTVSRVKADGKCASTKLVIDTPKTNSSLREIPIPDFLSQALLLVRRKSQSLYVVSDNATFVSPRTYEYRFHRFLEKAGIEDINYHTLRHTFATRCVEHGVDIKSLSEILGHSNVSVTLGTYVHSSLELKRVQMDKLPHYAF